MNSSLRLLSVVGRLEAPERRHQGSDYSGAPGGMCQTGGNLFASVNLATTQQRGDKDHQPQDQFDAELDALCRVFDPVHFGEAEQYETGDDHEDRAIPL